MKKIETIWHYLLFSALEKGIFKHTQLELAQKFGYSISTVHHALEASGRMGAIRKESKFFVLSDFSKLLYYWASVRNIESDILYMTNVTQDIKQIEGLVPPHSIYAGYSAAQKILTEPPADYGKVYIYLLPKDCRDAKTRFPPAGRKVRDSNVFVLRLHPAMLVFGKQTTLPQTFVDIWNLKDWYSRDFIRALATRMEEVRHGILS